jgi:hypothetical protein
VQGAVGGAAEAGCGWLHADWESDLDRFYTDACGFTPTSAGFVRCASRPLKRPQARGDAGSFLLATCCPDFDV